MTTRERMRLYQGIAVGVAASATFTMANSEQGRMALAMGVRMVMMPMPATWSMVSLGVVTAVGIWAMSRRLPTKGRSLSLWGVGADDFMAVQARIFPFMLKRKDVLGNTPSRLMEWLSGNVKQAPWSDTDIRDFLLFGTKRDMAHLDIPCIADVHTVLLHVCMLYLRGGHDKARELLGELARASLDPVMDIRHLVLDAEGNSTFIKWRDILRAKHAFPMTLLMAALEKAREHAVIPTGQMGFLKHLDHSTFMALNAVGRPGYYAPEALAWMSHYQCEIKAGKALQDMQVMPAVLGIRQELNQMNIDSLPIRDKAADEFG